MPNKFLIQNRTLLIGDVNRHRELISLKNFDNIKGGGSFYLENRTLYLYSSSLEFGKCSLEDVKSVKISGNYPDKYKMNWVFHTSDSLFQAITHGTHIKC